jgi:serine/threonine-protein kinase RsbW
VSGSEEVLGQRGETTVAVASGPLVGPVLRRVVGMLAARADLPLDRLDDAVLVADVIASRAPAHARDDEVRVALMPGERTLDLRLGPMRPGGGRALVVDAAVPGMGNVIEQLADELEVVEHAGSEYLRVRLAYAG